MGLLRVPRDPQNDRGHDQQWSQESEESAYRLFHCHHSETPPRLDFVLAEKNFLHGWVRIFHPEDFENAGVILVRG
jgi:hypothetical protein